MPLTPPIARGTPAGIRLRDGFPSKIALSNNPTISFWEKQVKPPGMDGGDAIDYSTMHNVLYRTRTARKLKTLTDITFSAAYDPNVYTQILGQINVEQAITVWWPDGSNLTFYGYLQKFEPSELREGEPPEASVTIIPTNQDPVTGAETAPVYVNVAGT